MANALESWRNRGAAVLRLAVEVAKALGRYRVVLLSLFGLLVVAWLVKTLELRRRLVVVGQPHGRILVGSPEVYTRERLVNDRSEQEEWLRGQLNRMDTLPFGVSAVLSKRAYQRAMLSANVGAAPASSDSAAGAVPPPAASGEVPTPSDPPLDVFRERAAYRDQLRAEIIENQLDDRHDLEGNTLYRLNFDISVFPSLKNHAYGIVEIILSRDNETRDDDADRAFFADWLRNLLSDAKATYRKREQEAWSAVFATEPRALLKGGPSAQGAPAATPAAAGASLAAPAPSAEVSEDLRAVAQLFAAAEKSGCDGEGAEADAALAKTVACIVKGQLAKLEPKKGLAAGEGLFKEKLTKVFTERMNQHYGALVHFADKAGELTLENLPSGGANPSELENPNSFLSSYARYRDMVKAVSTVYAYGVAPKESFDRLSFRAAYGDSLEARLAAAPLASAAVPAALAASGQRDSEFSAETIERIPRIVGFTGVRPKQLPPKKEETGTSASAAPPASAAASAANVQPAQGTAQQAEDGAHFGWIIGPRFRADGGAEPDFEQTVGHYVVSAIVSAPAWWTAAHVALIAYWYDCESNQYFNEGGESIRPVELGKWRDNSPLAVTDFDVALPLDPRPLGDVLFKDHTGSSPNDSLKQPAIDKEKMEPVAVTVGSRPEIVIPGRNLWRSPLVTLGSQQATRIKLLPNMNGLVAYFDPLVAPPNWNGVDEKLELVLTVWTSQKGSDSVKGKVILYPPPLSKTGPPSAASGAVPAAPGKSP